MRKILPLFLLLLAAGARLGAQPTWADDVAPILYANCTKCHNPNGIAPFSLLTYNDASSMSFYIGNAVASGLMPPWPPDTNYSRLAHERILKASERQAIIDWVMNGSPSGNLSNAPTPPTYTGSAEIITPDLVSQMPNYTVGSSTDIYRCFVVPSNLPQNEFITEVEVLPGNRSIVHHVLVYQDVANTCITLDNNDPGPGYTSFGGPGSSTATLVTGWVPGQGKYTLPGGMGIELQANANIIMQIHYPAGAIGQTDSTRVQFKFSGGSVRNVSLLPILNHDYNMTDGPLFIPANTIQTFHEQETAFLTASVLTVAPHMHLLGKSIKSWAVDPNGDTIPFISIPEWQFMWQGFYNFRQPVKVPAGSQLFAEAVYDNTSNNLYNPNTPPQNVSAGEATTDEMMIVYFAYTPYQSGDENIIIDSILLSAPPVMNDIVRTAQLYQPYPTPSSGNVNVQYFLPEKGSLTLELFDLGGRRVRLLENEQDAPAGFGTHLLSLEALSPGTYLLQLRHNGITRTKKIVRE